MQDNVLYSRVDEKTLTLVVVGRTESELSNLGLEIERFEGVKSIKLEKQVMDPFICTPEIPILPEAKAFNADDLEAHQLKSFPIPCAVAGCGLSCCYV